MEAAAIRRRRLSCDNVVDFAHSGIDELRGNDVRHDDKTAFREFAATEAKGVLYVGDMAPSGDNMFALDAATGKTLWSFPSGGSVNAGPAIVKGTVYWGSGYAHLGIPGFTGNNTFYAFSINGH